MKKLLLSLLFTFSSSAFAMLTSSDINLQISDNGYAQPKGGIVTIALSDALISDVQYNVTCHVSNPNAPDSIIFKFATTHTYCPTMGGCGGLMVNSIRMNSNQVKLTKTDNEIEFLQVMTETYDKETKITIQNLDNTATAIVSHCVAVPDTNITAKQSA